MYPGERFNTITHLVGTILAIVGTAALIPLAARHSTRALIALSLYGSMMIVMYLSSTLYHTVQGPAKRILHVFDHCAIYLLIAGTYTPFTLLTLHGVVGWTLFAIVWSLALIGILKDVFFHGRFKIASVVLYVVMGWLVVAAFGPLRQGLAPAGVMWLAAGGIVYTLGIVFYAMSRRVAYAHGLWHLCVIGGSVCHYIAVARYVV
jgi:hemolysin III